MILEYLNECLLTENAKVDKEYEKSFSNIPREVFDEIILLDPKTNVQGEDITNIGYIAKALLLPRYLEGDTDFLNNQEEIKELLIKYANNLGSYPKPNEFKSIEEFINTLKSDAVVNNVSTEKEKLNPLDKIYNQYYKESIPERETFDKIISLDPNTDEKSIGEVAKNLLLPKYISNTNEIKQIPEDKITRACNEYYQVKDSLPSDKQNVSSYKSVKEFVDYFLSVPDSNLVASLKNNNRRESSNEPSVKDAFRLVASTKTYDILEPKTHAANRAISGGESGNNWCTGWEGSGYWRRYVEQDGGRIFCFMNRQSPRDRNLNWQVRILNRGHLIEGDRTFVNGNDMVSGYPGRTLTEQFGNFLKAHPDILVAIKDEEPFNDMEVVKSAYTSLEYLNKPFTLTNDTRFEVTEDLKENVKELIIKNIDKVPSNLFSEAVLLKKITIGENVKEIGIQCFKKCPELTTINLPEGLIKIGGEAFADCNALRGSIRVPDSLIEVQWHAFANTHCDLKIPETRTNEIYFDEDDMRWVKDHVKSIKK